MPSCDGERDAIARFKYLAWAAPQDGRKVPVTRPAGSGYAVPDDALPVQWMEVGARLREAQLHRGDSASRSRVLLVWGSARNDGTCPGEVSKTSRLTAVAQQVVERAGMTRRCFVASAPAQPVSLGCFLNGKHPS